MSGRPFIYRFSVDLRLDDHAGLAAAAARGPIVPLLTVSASLETRLRASPRRAAFFCGAVAGLADELRQRGSALIVRRGAGARGIVELARATGAAGAAWSAAYDAQGMSEDRDLQSELEEAGLEAALVHDAPVVEPETISTAHSADGSGYRAFAPYFERWWRVPAMSYESPLLLRFISPDVALEPLPKPEEFGSPYSGLAVGPALAKGTFERFLRERAPHYAVAGMIPAESATSQLGAHLSFGVISARTVARGVRERLGDPFSLSEERNSLKVFLRALARRDFFLQLSWFHPRTENEALQEKMIDFPFAQQHPLNDSWRTGETGFPLVDAGIRQLHETGWMHPRVRAVAASVLCFDLGVDWRVGRADWNGRLVEDDPALATGNWQWIAGVGADMAQFPRIYNPERQRRHYDPEGAYVRRWVPELRHIPPQAWHGRESNSAQLALALFDGNVYPKPFVDHALAAREFLARYRAFVSP